MEDLITNYLENNDVTFKMTCVVNGEEIITFTGNSFDDVSEYSQIADEAFEQHVQNEAYDMAELMASIELDNLIQEQAQ